MVVSERRRSNHGIVRANKLTRGSQACPDFSVDLGRKQVEWQHGEGRKRALEKGPPPRLLGLSLCSVQSDKQL